MIAEPLKRCSKCRVEKPLGDFYRDASKSDGRKAACKACLRDGEREYGRRRSKEKVREQTRRRTADGRNAEDNRRKRARRAARSDAEVAAKQAEMWPNGLRPCKRGCGALLPFDAFSRDASTPDGLNSYCRPCNVAAVIARRHSAYAPSWDERGLYACYLCGAPYEHADHKHPKALGGVDDVENLAPACAPCNLSKSDTLLEDFRPDLFDLVASWPCELRLVSAA